MSDISLQVTNSTPVRGANKAPRGAQTPEEAAARRAAMQFEALLLNQLTASLNSGSDEEEGGLFGGGNGLGLSKQLFGEQLSTTMAEGGGVGLSGIILEQLLGRAAGGGRETQRAFSAARLIREHLTHHPAPEARAVTHVDSPEGGGATAPRRPVPSARYADPVLISEAGGPEVTSGVAGASLGTPSAAPNDPSQNNPVPAIRPRRVFPATSSASPLDASRTGNNGTASAQAGVEPSQAPQKLHTPVQGLLRSNFGARRDPFTGERKYHHGVDIAAPRGTPIETAAAGRVVFAGRQRGYGNTVIVEHADGRRTRYAHADRLLVKAGDAVSSSQVIATVGSTGRSTGPHLHFEVMENGRHLNPLKVLANDITLARR